jgi:hypothetical protein
MDKGRSLLSLLVCGLMERCVFTGCGMLVSLFYDIRFATFGSVLEQAQARLLRIECLHQQSNSNDILYSRTSPA